ncbi:MAG: 16S rRNA processing protein RimM [Thermoleophilaceae bacterium]|nr:16S rRNA processing protein RimM [Thermoleophilaceae bacterium]
MDPQDRIQIGVVGKPHGVRGGFYMDGSVDSPALTAGLKLQIGSASFVLASRGGTDKRPLLTLEEVSSKEAIAELRGEAVFAARGDLTPLSEGEWFADDLIGLAVVDGAGRAIGQVTRMSNLPSADVLEVAADGGGQLLIPMIRDAIVSIEPAGAGVTVNSDFLGLG